MKAQKGWRGYISSREIGSSFIPQRVQNMVIRNYAQSKGMLFLLSATEYYMNNCYMMLNGLLEEATHLDGIIFYSLNLLPPNLWERQKIYTKIFEQDCELHFALEEIAICGQEDIALIEDIINCKLLASNVSRTILGV